METQAKHVKVKDDSSPCATIMYCVFGTLLFYIGAGPIAYVASYIFDFDTGKPLMVNVT